MEVYVLCMADYEYTQIFGIFTDKEKLRQAYHKIVEDDSRCADKKYPIMPEIYRFQLNEFTAWMNDWDEAEYRQYYDCCDKNIVRIEEI